MKELKTKKVDLFVSNDVFSDLGKRLKKNSEIATYLADKIDDLFHEDKNFQRYIETYSMISGFDGFAVLEADGGDLANLDEGYRDGKRARRVQRWIDEHDGKYACLFLCVSGISEKSIRSVKSLLFIPDYGVSDRVFHLYSPIHDIIDSNLIESSLKELEGLKGSTLEEAKKIIEERRLEEFMEVNGLKEDN